MSNGTRKPMRQGQQNRRGRGRGRKPQNPLSRNLESNGPDVKIRGTASHIAEKYTTLARDAQVTGDSVAWESYLQHAEHYNRIIMANQAQQQAAQASQGEGMNGAGRERQNPPSDGDGGARNEAAPDAAAASDSAASDRGTAQQAQEVKAAPDAAVAPETSGDAASDAAPSGETGDDAGLARMMSRPIKKSGNGSEKEKPAKAAKVSKKKAVSDDAISDDAGADDAPDEAVT